MPLYYDINMTPNLKVLRQRQMRCPLTLTSRLRKVFLTIHNPSHITFTRQGTKMHALWKILNEQEWQCHYEWEYKWFASHINIYFLYGNRIHILITHFIYFFFFWECKTHCKKLRMELSFPNTIPILRVWPAELPLSPCVLNWMPIFVDHSRL